MDNIYLGIDFGTSTIYITEWNSKKKKAEPLKNTIVKQYGGNNFIESVIYYEGLTNHILGELAFNRGVQEPLNVIESIKRQIENEDWESHKILSLGKNLKAIEICTDIFRYIKKGIETNYGGRSVDGVVISVPFAFQHRERQIIKESAELAGLNVLDLIEEPVAAAISYGLFENVLIKGKKEKILIYDLGGGTFDVTIFELQKTSESEISIEVLNTDGHKNLGGKDIDEIVFNKFIQSIPDYDYENISNSSQKRKDFLSLIKEARKVKEELSSYTETSPYLSGLFGNKELEIDITRDDFNKWLKGNGFLNKIREVLENCLYDIDLGPEDIDKIVLVGGSSNIPIIQEEIYNFFHKKPEAVKNPGELVGEGAGIYCGSRIDKTLNYNIVRKTSHGIGIKVEGKFVELVKRNSKYQTYSDLKQYEIKGTTEKVKIPIYSGNTTDIKKCSLINEIIINRTDIIKNKIGIKLGTTKDGMIVYQLFRTDESKPYKEGEL